MPLASKVPPVGVLYQSVVSPVPGKADKETVPVPHREAGVTAGAAGVAIIVTVIAALGPSQLRVVCWLA